MFTASSTPNQTRSMPSFSATGASSGTTMKDSSKKSRKKASRKIRMFTTIRKPSWPPGRPVSRCSTQRGPSTPWNDQAEDGGADQDEQHEAGQLHGGVQRLLQQPKVKAPARQRHDEGAQRAHGAAFGGRRDAQEDGAQDEEDQRQRRDQHEGHALGHARQQAQARDPVDHREHEGEPTPRTSRRRWSRRSWCAPVPQLNALAAERRRRRRWSARAARAGRRAVVLADRARLRRQRRHRPGCGQIASRIT